MRLPVLLSLVVASAWGAPLEPRGSSIRAGYTTTFFDDFSQTPGSLPAAASWLIVQGTSYPGGAPAWGNGELETYTSSVANIHVTTGQTLAITPCRNSDTRAWTSGRVETSRSDFAAAPGGTLLVEGRIKLGDAPAAHQEGIWHAFWALGASFRGSYNNWPGASEWGLMENLNGQATVYAALHCGTLPGGLCNEPTGIGNGGLAFVRAGWHVYTLRVDRSMVGPGKPGSWLDETITWLLDGVTVLTVAGSHINDLATWEQIAHQGHFLLLNVAVGGYWPGYPNSETTDGPSVQMEVDYVGVWNS